MNKKLHQSIIMHWFETDINKRITVGIEQRHRIPPGPWVQIEPLLRRIGSVPLVDPTKFWEDVKDAHIRLCRHLHIGHECHVTWQGLICKHSSHFISGDFPT